MAGQSVMDRVAAVKHSIAGQGLAKSVCKATTEEIIGPKKKHLDYLLQCTNEPNVSIPQMADLLIERTQHQSWVVVFKSLISIHNLMNLGNERFTQYLASNNCSFNLSGFVDKGGVQGYDMSTYIRRYAKYLNEKAVSYRSMAFDFCKVKRGKDDGLLRTMNSEKLLKTLPVLQQQLDALLEFDCTPNELTNGVITACFMLLFKDLIRLFACYNDGIINLLEKYFDMNKKQCKDALDLYKRFLVRMDKVSEFLKVAENMGIDKGDIPDLAKAPASLLDALEQHLGSLEGKKSATTPTGSSKPSGFTTALNNMSSNTFTVSEAEKKRILEEENQQLQRHKGEEDAQPAEVEMPGDEEGEVDFEQKLKDNTSPQKLSAIAAGAPTANNPFSSPSSGQQQPQQQQDLFGSPVNNTAKASDDLLSLASNPFASNVQDVMATAYQPPANSAPNNPFGTPAFQTNGVGAASANNFDADFANAFNTGTNAQGPAPSSGAPPGLDLGSPLDPLGEDMMMPSDMGIGGVGGGSTLLPSPSPVASTSPAVGGPFSDLEGLDQPLSVSPCPSPFGGLGGLSPGGGMGRDALSLGGGLFGGPSVGITPTSGFGAPMAMGGDISGGGGVSPGMMPGTTAMGCNMMGGGGHAMGLGTGSQLFGGQMQQQQMPQQPPSNPMAVPGAGVKLGAYCGLSGSPVRVMTRGGVSPGPSSLSSSPSGPGLEDAVKALGLSMSPSKSATSKSKGLAAVGQNRPTSPGYTMGGIEPVMASGQAASFGFSDTGAPGGYKGFEQPGEAGEVMAGGYIAGGMTTTHSEGIVIGGESAQAGSGFDAFGDVMAPMNKSPSHQAHNSQGGKPMGGDLDSSLASLASNLNVSGGTGQLKKDHQWQPKGENRMTGGNQFQRQPIAASTTNPAPPQWGAPQPGFQQQPNMMTGVPGGPMMYGQQQMGMPMGQPMMGMTPQPMGMQQPGMMGMGQQPMMYGAGAPRMASPAVGAFGQPAAPMQQQAPASQTKINDPFGAL